MLKDITPGFARTDFHGFFPLNDRVFFWAQDDSMGTGLWISDGTEGGTTMIGDLNPGPAGSWPVGYFEFEDKFYFFANQGGLARVLWESDGTEAGTIPVENWDSEGMKNFGQPRIIDNYLYFKACDIELGSAVFRFPLGEGTDVPPVAGHPNMKEITLYPNPAGNEILIRMERDPAVTCRILVLDVSGRQLMEQEIVHSEKSDIRLDITQLEKGLYMIVVRMGGQPITCKFIKR